MQKKSLKSSQDASRQHPPAENELEHIARSIVEQNAFSPPVEQQDAEIANVIRLFKDYPDLLATIQTHGLSEKRNAAPKEKQPLTQELVVNMARFHFVTQAGIASSKYLQHEVDRYINENGNF